MEGTEQEASGPCAKDRLKPANRLRKNMAPIRPLKTSPHSSSLDLTWRRFIPLFCLSHPAPRAITSAAIPKRPEAVDGFPGAADATSNGETSDQDASAPPPSAWWPAAAPRQSELNKLAPCCSDDETTSGIVAAAISSPQAPPARRPTAVEVLHSAVRAEPYEKDKRRGGGCLALTWNDEGSPLPYNIMELIQPERGRRCDMYNTQRSRM